MAVAGFHSNPLAGAPDNATCIMCDRSYAGWQSSDVPWKKHFPTCSLLKLDTLPGRLATFVKFGWPMQKHPSICDRKASKKLYKTLLKFKFVQFM